MYSNEISIQGFYLKISVILFTVLIKISISLNNFLKKYLYTDFLSCTAKNLNLSISPNTKIYCSHVRSLLELASVYGVFL